MRRKESGVLHAGHPDDVLEAVLKRILLSCLRRPERKSMSTSEGGDIEDESEGKNQAREEGGPECVDRKSAVAERAGEAEECSFGMPVPRSPHVGVLVRYDEGFPRHEL